VKKYVYPYYLTVGEKIITAKVPYFLILRAIAGAGLLSHLLISILCNHLPFLGICKINYVEPAK